MRVVERTKAREWGTRDNNGRNRSEGGRHPFGGVADIGFLRRKFVGRRRRGRDGLRRVSHWGSSFLSEPREPIRRRQPMLYWQSPSFLPSAKPSARMVRTSSG